MKIILNVRDYDDHALVDFATTHDESLVAEAFFTNPDPASAAFMLLVAALGDKLGEITIKEQELAALYIQRDTARGALEDGLEKRAFYVGNKTGVTEDLVRKVGLRLRARPVPVGDLPAPEDFSVTRSDAEGTVDGQCHCVPGASSYKSQQSVNRDGPWLPGYEGTKSSFTLGGLTPGVMTYHRMAALGPNGLSPWSDIAQCRVA